MLRTQETSMKADFHQHHLKTLLPTFL